MAQKTAREAAEEYASKVLAGRVPAGKYAKAACRRFQNDLKTGHRRGLWFDDTAAQHVVDFFDFLKHSKGEWAGCAFGLQPWQIFILANVFGWKNRDGFRRFRIGYIEVPRKNGKSTFIAGILLYLFVADGEPGAEIYTAATKKDQARITHSEAMRMVKKSPELRSLVHTLRDNLSIEATESKFEPLGADEDTLDGLNPHAAGVDELHAHKKRGLWDVLDTATGSRRQSLLLAITTAGTDQTSICYEQHEYCIKIVTGAIQDDSVFGYIACADKEDDYSKAATHRKANPNYGISVKPDDLRRKVRKAKEMPAALNAFLRLHLNIWTQQVDRWLSLELWDKNDGLVDEGKLRGRTCYGGLDLSSVSDITAWVMAFPGEDDNERIDVLARLWVPEARLHDKENRYQQQYQAWAREGWLLKTPGDAVDYSYIKHQILADAAAFGLVDANVDRLFQGHQLAMELEGEGVAIVPMGQGFMSMSTPTKELARCLLHHKINHGGHPVLRWMADNVAVKQDAAGNLKPDKSQSQGKIDGIVALIMAIDRAMRRDQHESVYETRGLVEV